ncbi:MAG TPA: hypothetical protein VFM09_08735 [Marmoricola sp.]|nr:hypothetical protein [Marmoricola sp.]
MRTRGLFLLAVVLIVVGVGVALYRGAGPLPNPEGCTATVEGHRVDLATDQAENATLIAAIGVRRGLPARAVSIALATAFQESKIRNLSGGDRDSLGIFQQRPSQGWGTPRQLRNRYYAINAFYDALQKVGGYEHMRITDAAQQVQRSGFPQAYANHEADARALASALTGYSAGGRFSCVVHDSARRGTASHVVHALRHAYGPALAVRRTGIRQDLVVAVPRTPAGRRLGWSVAQFLVGQAKRLHLHDVRFDGKRWTTGAPSSDGWTRVAHSPRTRINVSLG